MKKVWVEVDGRKFAVHFDDKGIPQRIRERKLGGKAPITYYYDATYWDARHHAIGADWTVTARVLAAAKEKHAVQSTDRS
jgi:imidazoleglycerol phosphate dehydratase HisB